MRGSRFLLAAAILAAATGGASAYKLKTLHTFCQVDQCRDGARPMGGAIRDEQGNLYGAFAFDGQNFQGGGVYKLALVGTKWTYTMLYGFCAQTGCADGSFPRGNLIRDVNGNLYGVTYEGGAHDKGTVFELLPAAQGFWTLKTLHTFCEGGGSCSDGMQPVAKLTYAGDAQGQLYDGQSPLYGTTSGGGANNSGAAFSLTPQGAKRWRYQVANSFCAGGDFHCADGQGPYGELLLDGMGDMFGTTFLGGMSNQSGSAYELVPAHKGKFKERVLFAFSGFSPSDTGNAASGGFAMSGAGLLYGTTSNGGANFEGVLYSLALHGKNPATQTILHQFCSLSQCADGSAPMLSTPVLDASGTLFGTAGNAVYRYQNGSYSTIYTFCTQTGCPDGYSPNGLSLDSNGNLWGTTKSGAPGGQDDGPGTVFELTP